MAVDANANETYKQTLIREDLQEEYTMISPEETPFTTSVRSETATNTLFEWPVIELSDLNYDNREAEGEESPSTDTPTNGIRLSNYTQISDKVVTVPHTAQAVDSAANDPQKINKQVVFKLAELKRDMEGMMLDNVAANAGSSGNARVSAGLAAFLKTNTAFQTGGSDPTLSGTTEGFPNAAAGAASENAGSSALFSEDDLNQVIEDAWSEGGKPSIIMCNSGNKRRISSAFTGNSTRYKDAIDKKLVNSIDFYDSNFGELTVVPNRWMRTNNPGGNADSYNVFILDPEYAAIAFLDTPQQKPLAETGHALRTLVWAEYGLQVDNEKAHGVIRDTNNQIS